LYIQVTKLAKITLFVTKKYKFRLSCGIIEQYWHRVFGSRIAGSTILAGSGRVGSGHVSVTDPASDTVL